MNNKYSDYISIDFTFNDLNDNNDLKNILYELLNQLIPTMPDYNDFIHVALNIFIILIPLKYSDINNINFETIKVIDKKYNKTLTMNINSRIIIYNETSPQIIYELENYTPDNYNNIILKSFDFFNFYYTESLKC